MLSVLTCQSEEEAIALANDTIYGLTASVYTQNLSTAHRVARALRRHCFGELLLRRGCDDAVWWLQTVRVLWARQVDFRPSPVFGIEDRVDAARYSLKAAERNMTWRFSDRYKFRTVGARCCRPRRG